MNKKEKVIKRLESLKRRSGTPELKQHYQNLIDKEKEENENT